MRRFALILLALPFAACSPTPSCPDIAVKHWTSSEQEQILAEEKKLAPDSILIPVIEDYAKLRREVQ